MDFKNANELLALCEEKNLPISEIMRIREIELGETASEIVNKKMTRVLGIMKDAAFSPIRQPVKSMGGLIGGEKAESPRSGEKRSLRKSASEGNYLCYGYTGNECLHGADRGLSYCRFCRNRTGADAGNAGTLSIL